jgi:protein-tyrosine phosphatase
VIDIHIHILHGLDDGPPDLAASLAMARACVAGGTTMAVATPHIRDDYRFPLERIDERARELRQVLREEGIPLEVLTGGEVSLAKADDMTDDQLRHVSLARGAYLLVESPYSVATDFLENSLFDLQVRGFRPVLAHPERSPSLQDDPERMAALVDRGILTSITAASMEGRFGEMPRRAAVEMLDRGLVHDVASDAHDTRRRPPTLLGGFATLDEELPGLRSLAPWFTEEVPRAMLMREDIETQPLLEMRRRSRLRRGLRRLR